MKFKADSQLCCCIYFEAPGGACSAFGRMLQCATHWSQWHATYLLHMHVLLPLCRAALPRCSSKLLLGTLCTAVSLLLLVINRIEQLSVSSHFQAHCIWQLVCCALRGILNSSARHADHQGKAHLLSAYHASKLQLACLTRHTDCQSASCR